MQVQVDLGLSWVERRVEAVPVDVSVTRCFELGDDPLQCLAPRVADADVLADDLAHPDDFVPATLDLRGWLGLAFAKDVVGDHAVLEHVPAL